MVIYVDEITVSVGASAGSKTDITTIERFKCWEASDQGDRSMRPILVMNTVNPVGWRQAHKWIEGELHVKSEATAAFASYVKSGTTHITVPYFVAVVRVYGGTSKTYTFGGKIFFMQPDLTVAHTEEGISIYKFVADTVAIT